MEVKLLVQLILVAAAGLALYLLIPFRPKPRRYPTSDPATVDFNTEDGKRIVADYYPGATSRGALLVHMMPRTRESWKYLAYQLQARGYHALAIDLHGHGASTGGPDTYRSFSDREHQESLLDLQAGVKYLAAQGVSSEDLIVIGASIGANLALWLLVDQPRVRQAVLLSAGLEYKGIKARELVRDLTPGQRILLFSSADDDRSGGNNAEANRMLESLTPKGVATELIVYQNAGHGSDILETTEQPNPTQAILTWLAAGDTKKNK
ncbi:MAG: alpha/beta fold hydrolase [Candidatus Liptonbacteria bacterium]|nr:alpha/beta fold hydrolase [Candidatus Liptonbacteria bacterium]